MKYSFIYVCKLGSHLTCVILLHVTAGIAGGMQNLSLHQPSAATVRSLGTGNSQVTMTCVCVCVCVYVCACMCVRACVCVHACVQFSEDKIEIVRSHFFF